MDNKKIEYIVRIEYCLELLECFVDELSKIQGLERVGMIRPVHELITKETNREKEAYLTDADNARNYGNMKEQAVTLLANGKKQIKEILDNKNIHKILKG